MAKQRVPWDVRPQDFSKPGWHARPTVGYELMFEYLRLSPSYALARKATEQGLTADERAAVPTDFEDVLHTYGLLGDVQKVLFRAWWLKRGLKIFGNPSTKPKVHLLDSLPSGKDADIADIAAGLGNYLTDTRRSEGLNAALLVSIPLGMRRRELHRHINALLAKHTVGDDALSQKPQIKLMGRRLRKTVLVNGLRLLWFRAAKPKWEYWRLGAKARLSRTYSKQLNFNGPRKPINAIEQVIRETMTKMTYRALIKFETIAENAARGRFPCELPVQRCSFDYPRLASIIAKKNAWEKSEYERLLKLHNPTASRTGI